MSRQAFLSMPLSFAIVLVAGVALSGAGRQDGPGLRADPAAESSPITSPEALDQPEPPAAPPPADEPAPKSAAIEPHQETEPQVATEFQEQIEPHDANGAQAPSPESEVGPPLLSDATDEEDQITETPEPSVTGRGREHWRPIAPSPSKPRP